MKRDKVRDESVIHEDQGSNNILVFAIGVHRRQYARHGIPLLRGDFTGDVGRLRRRLRSVITRGSATSNIVWRIIPLRLGVSVPVPRGH